jgi:hypothetical protein
MKNHCKSQITNGRGDTEHREVSRRHFFQQTVRGAVVVGAGAVSAMTMSGPVQAQYGGGPYVWKSIAAYRDAPNGPQFCARCVHFRPPAGCQIVEPPISPSGGAVTSIRNQSFVTGGARLSARRIEASN